MVSTSGLVSCVVSFGISHGFREVAVWKGAVKMIENMQKLIEDEAMAYFKADVCLGSPESFSLDEKREICEQMESTSKAIEDALKADFESLPPEFRFKLLDMLCSSGCESEEFWKDLLLEEMPESPEDLAR
jgi:actin-like ATPase involved in cell morphogenesis